MCHMQRVSMLMFPCVWLLCGVVDLPIPLCTLQRQSKRGRVRCVGVCEHASGRHFSGDVRLIQLWADVWRVPDQVPTVLLHLICAFARAQPSRCAEDDPSTAVLRLRWYCWQGVGAVIRRHATRLLCSSLQVHFETDRRHTVRYVAAVG